MSELRSRFKDAIWFPKEETELIIGGAGGIGSWLSISLARAGFLPIVFDFDRIEAHNIGGQAYSKQDIGDLKVDALKKRVMELCNIDLFTFNSAYDENSMASAYMFSAFDNMKARKDMFNNWKKENSENPDAIFIDGRLTMEQLQIYCVTPDKIEEYEKTLFDDSEVEEDPCTLKQTSHGALMIASLMTAFFTNHLTNVVEKAPVRDVPFFYEYFIPLNLVS